MKRRAIRCCGRFAFWRVPLGPWMCSHCGRELAAGPMPKSAYARFDAYVAERMKRGPDRRSPRRLELTPRLWRAFMRGQPLGRYLARIERGRR